MCERDMISFLWKVRRPASGRDCTAQAFPYYSAKQKAVTAYFSSKQLLPFGFARRDS